MWKQMVASGLSIMMLVGCDSAEKTDVKSSNVVAQGQQAQQKNSGTAIYLPGGAGVDFGRKPVSDKVIEDNVSKIRIIQYEFDEAYDVVDESVASVLLPENYLRKENPLGSLKLSATYIKAGAGPVLARYNEVNQEGSDKKSVLTLSWRF